MMRLRNRTGIIILFLVFTLFCGKIVADEPYEHWVGIWGCALQLTEPSNLPPDPGLTDNTLRQVVHVSAEGTHLRFKISNEYG